MALRGRPFLVMQGKSLLKDNIVAILMGVGGIITFYVNFRISDVESEHHREMMYHRIEVLENRLDKKIKVINKIKEDIEDLKKCPH